MESNHELALAMRSSLDNLGQTVSGVDGALVFLQSLLLEWSNEVM
jgi:hypothetical protein